MDCEGLSCAKNLEMKKRKTLLLMAFISIGFVVGVSCSQDDPELEEEPETENECGSYTYNADIKAIVDQKCANPYCHGSGSGVGDWTSYSLLKVALDDGSFNREVLVDKTMPKGGALDDSELKAIECWYKEGYPEE